MAKYSTDFSDRHTYLGASEVAAAIGMSDFGDGPEEQRRLLWEKKMLLFKEPHKSIFDRGHDMEAVMVEMLAREGVNVVNQQMEFVHPDLPWLVSHVDGMYNNYEPILDEENNGFEYEGRGVHEMKAPGSGAVRKYMIDGLPADYILQLQTSCINAGTTWGRFVFLDYDKYRLVSFIMPYDPAVSSGIISGCKEFWKMVQDGEYTPLEKKPSIVLPVLGDETAIITDEDSPGYRLLNKLADTKLALDKAKYEHGLVRERVTEWLLDRGVCGVEAPGLVRAPLIVRKPSVTWNGAKLATWTEDLCNLIISGEGDLATKAAYSFLADSSGFKKENKGGLSIRVKVEKEDW